MAQIARSFFVLLTTVSALAAGALNGRVVCVTDAGHVALEEPHPRVAYSPHDHGCVGSCGAGDERDAGHRAPDGNDADHHGAGHHGAPPADDCTDIGPGETLVREVAPAAYGHEHAQLALPLVPLVVAATLLATSPCPPPREHDGGPPSASDLAALRSVILVI